MDLCQMFHRTDLFDITHEQSILLKNKLALFFFKLLVCNSMFEPIKEELGRSSVFMADYLRILQHWI